MPPITVLDFHAEATGEKGALARYLDGRVSAVFGTHTHVQTADETILPGGTGFITDLGMTGPTDSVLGVKPELVIQKMRSKLPVRFETAKGDCRMDAVLFCIDEKTARTVSVERIQITRKNHAVCGGICTNPGRRPLHGKEISAIMEYNTPFGEYNGLSDKENKGGPMINGIVLRDALISGANNMARQKDLVNQLNIFPVPDGDTGTNSP